MLHKTPWQIFYTRDNFSLETELVQYIQGIQQLFEGKRLNANDLLPLLTELLPSDVSQLVAMQIRLNSILRPEDKSAVGYSTDPGEWAFSLLEIAITHKLNVLGVVQDSLQSLAIKLRQEIADHNASQGSSKAEVSRDLTIMQKSLETLDKFITVAEKLQGLSDLARHQRIIVAVECIKNIESKLSADSPFKALLISRVARMDDHLIKINESSHKIAYADNPEAFHQAVATASADLNEVILQITGNVNKILVSKRKEISQQAYSALEIEYLRFANFSPLIATSSSANETYKTLLNFFQKTYLDLVDKIEVVSLSSHEADYRERNREALKEADLKFSALEYPYQISEARLRKSKNIFFESQLSYNSHAIANSDKYIVMGNSFESLANLKMDMQRNLLIVGEKMPSDLAARATDDEIIRLLESKLGVENTALLAKYYNQATLGMMTAAVNESAGSGNNGMEGARIVPFAGGKGHSDNLYVKAGILYRESAVTEFMIQSPEHPEDLDKDDVWIYKTNIKILSMLSQDGFSVTRIGTDSAFVCNSLLEESTRNDLQSIIKSVITYQEKFSAMKIEHEAKLPSTRDKLSVINLVLGQISYFKKGFLSFDDITKKLSEMVIQYEPLIKDEGYTLFKGKDNLLGNISAFSTELDELQKGMSAKAIGLQVKPTVSSALEPPTVDASATFVRNFFNRFSR